MTIAMTYGLHDLRILEYLAKSGASVLPNELRVSIAIARLKKHCLIESDLFDTDYRLTATGLGAATSGRLPYGPFDRPPPVSYVARVPNPDQLRRLHKLRDEALRAPGSSMFCGRPIDDRTKMFFQKRRAWSSHLIWFIYPIIEIPIKHIAYLMQERFPLCTDVTVSMMRRDLGIPRRTSAICIADNLRQLLKELNDEGATLDELAGFYHLPKSRVASAVAS